MAEVGFVVALDHLVAGGRRGIGVDAERPHVQPLSQRVPLKRPADDGDRTHIRDPDDLRAHRHRADPPLQCCTVSIVLYTADECPFCVRTRLVLDGKGIDHERVEIDLGNKPRLAA